MKEKKLSYEEAVKQLEKTIENLEQDESSLSESVEMFKKGVELYKHCNNLLLDVEGEVKMLLDDSDDSFVKLDFFEEVDRDNF